VKLAAEQQRQLLSTVSEQLLKKARQLKKPWQRNVDFEKFGRCFCTWWNGGTGKQYDDPFCFKYTEFMCGDYCKLGIRFSPNLQKWICPGPRQRRQCHKTGLWYYIPKPAEHQDALDRIAMLNHTGALKWLAGEPVFQPPLGPANDDYIYACCGKSDCRCIESPGPYRCVLAERGLYFLPTILPCPVSADPSLQWRSCGRDSGLGECDFPAPPPAASIPIVLHTTHFYYNARGKKVDWPDHNPGFDRSDRGNIDGEPGPWSKGTGYSLLCACKSPYLRGSRVSAVLDIPAAYRKWIILDPRVRIAKWKSPSLIYPYPPLGLPDAYVEWPYGYNAYHLNDSASPGYTTTMCGDYCRLGLRWSPALGKWISPGPRQKRQDCNTGLWYYFARPVDLDPFIFALEHWIDPTDWPVGYEAVVGPFETGADNVSGRMCSLRDYRPESQWTDSDFIYSCCGKSDCQCIERPGPYRCVIPERGLYLLPSIHLAEEWSRSGRAGTALDKWCPRHYHHRCSSVYYCRQSAIRYPAPGPPLHRVKRMEGEEEGVFGIYQSIERENY
jgi:hypothetical protein